jgi:peptidoglycan/LPS O-acetylase OafA/YrhL
VFVAFYRWLSPAGSPVLQIAWVVSFLAFMFMISWLMAKFVDEPVTKLVKVPKLQRIEPRTVAA